MSGMCAGISDTRRGVNCVRKQPVWDTRERDEHCWRIPKHFLSVRMSAWGSFTLPICATTTTLSRCDGRKAHCLSTGVRSSGVCSLPACPLGITQPTIREAEKSFCPLSCFWRRKQKGGWRRKTIIRKNTQKYIVWGFKNTPLSFWYRNREQLKKDKKKWENRFGNRQFLCYPTMSLSVDSRLLA